MYFIRLRLVVQDRSGRRFVIAFHDDNSRSPINCKVDETTAIFYAEQHGFLDFSDGIRQEDPDTFTVRDMSMSMSYN